MAKTKTTPNDAQDNSANSVPVVEKTPEQLAAIEKLNALQAEEARLKEEKKALKALAKGEKPKEPKVLKGQKVTFKTKSGETVTGLGVLYYVTRMNGKLYYKEASQVTLLPEDANVTEAPAGDLDS